MIESKNVVELPATSSRLKIQLQSTMIFHWYESGHLQLMSIIPDLKHWSVSRHPLSHLTSILPENDS